MNVECPASEPTSPERRRPGRPKHEPIPLEVMQREEGRPLTPRELGDLCGMSADKIRTLLRTHYLRGVPVPSAHGQRFQWLIPYREAQRWLRELRMIPDPTPTVHGART